VPLTGIRRAVECDSGITLGDGRGDGRLPDLVAPTREQIGQLGFALVGRVHRTLAGQRVDEAVRAVDLVE
jgi:hypothetical protein